MMLSPTHVLPIEADSVIYAGNTTASSPYTPPVDPSTVEPAISNVSPGPLEQLIEAFQVFSGNKYVQLALLGIGITSIAYLAYDVYQRSK